MQQGQRKRKKAIGFHACVTVPCWDHHRDIFAVVHVCDFLCPGEPGDFAPVKSELETSFEWNQGEDKYIQEMMEMVINDKKEETRSWTMRAQRNFGGPRHCSTFRHGICLT